MKKMWVTGSHAGIWFLRLFSLNPAHPLVDNILASYFPIQNKAFGIDKERPTGPNHLFPIIFTIRHSFPYMVGPLPLRNPMVPPSAVIRLTTSSNKMGAKSVCSTHTQ